MAGLRTGKGRRSTSSQQILLWIKILVGIVVGLWLRYIFVSDRLWTWWLIGKFYFGWRWASSDLLETLRRSQYNLFGCMTFGRVRFDKMSQTFDPILHEGLLIDLAGIKLLFNATLIQMLVTVAIQGNLFRKLTIWWWAKRCPAHNVVRWHLVAILRVVCLRKIYDCRPLRRGPLEYLHLFSILRQVIYHFFFYPVFRLRSYEVAKDTPV